MTKETNNYISNEKINFKRQKSNLKKKISSFF